MIISVHCFRFLLALWLFFCLIICSIYSGALKSQMAVPQLTKPIDTIHDIYESGLPVEMVDYGDHGPLDMSRSSDPIVRHIHANRIIKEFSPIVQASSLLVLSNNSYLTKQYITSNVAFPATKCLLWKGYCN